MISTLKPYGHWFLRIALASVFLYHGLTKFPMAEAVAGMLDFPVIVIYLLSTLETIGGILILLGGLGMDLATRLSGGIFSVIMLGAIAKVHIGQWSFMATQTHPMGGMEFQVVLLLMSLYFVVRGNDDTPTA